MSACAHLWAIGYDDMEGAEQLRAEVARLGESRCLILRDTALVVRCRDGSFTLNGEPIVSIPYFRSHSFAGFLAALALGAPPLTGATADALVRGAGGTAGEAGIDEDFINEVQALMKPGTSALFVLDQEGNIPAILQGIRGLGGTVLRTNVDVQRAQLVQSTLAARDAQVENRP
jgi:uncharacterized membrane protein